MLKGLGPSRDPYGMPEKIFVDVELKTVAAARDLKLNRKKLMGNTIKGFLEIYKDDTNRFLLI